MNYPNDMV